MVTLRLIWPAPARLCFQFGLTVTLWFQELNLGWVLAKVEWAFQPL